MQGERGRADAARMDMDVQPLPPPAPLPQEHLRDEKLEPPVPPPPDAAVDAAGPSLTALRAQHHELRFARAGEGVLVIEVYDGAGRLLRRIPPGTSEAQGSASWRA
jgi:hypothetical protein